MGNSQATSASFAAVKGLGLFQLVWVWQPNGQTESDNIFLYVSTLYSDSEAARGSRGEGKEGEKLTVLFPISRRKRGKQETHLQAAPMDCQQQLSAASCKRIQSRLLIFTLLHIESLLNIFAIIFYLILDTRILIQTYHISVRVNSENSGLAN